MVENSSTDDFKDTLRKVKLTKNRSDVLSTWLITFERIDTKILAFCRFVARQLAILIHFLKFKIHLIFTKQQLVLLR